jgi:hypothetical protein
MRRVVLVLATMALAILVAGGVAKAIINGEPDRGPKAHPYVGALVTVPTSGQFKGQRIPVCSGTLISPKVFLTAGHCTDLLMKEDLPSYVSFDPTYKPGASRLQKGTPYTHPKFCNAAKEGCPRYDAGVIVLKEPVRMATHGALPKAGLVDTLREGQRLTAVGYCATRYKIGGGLRPQPIYPGDRNRATVRLLNTKDSAEGEMFVKTTGVSLTGGKGASSCHGDSGGPLFMPNQRTIVGVTSFGIAPLCRGPAYYQRMDLPRVLKWVRSFS